MSSKDVYFYALLLADHVEFEKDIDSPVFVKVSRHKSVGKVKKTLFRAQTAFQMTDANKMVHFYNEFCMKIKIAKRHGHSTSSKQIVNVKLGLMNAKRKKREKIGTWHFDAANFEDPEGSDIRTSQTHLKHHLGNATLFFRCTIVPCSNFPSGAPTNFYNFVTNKIVAPQFIDVNLTQLTTSTLASEVTETENEDNNIPLSIVKIIPQKSSDVFRSSNALAGFIKPIDANSPAEVGDSNLVVKEEEKEEVKHKDENVENKDDDVENKEEKKKRLEQRKGNKNANLNAFFSKPSNDSKKKRNSDFLQKGETKKYIINNETQENDENNVDNNDENNKSEATSSRYQKEFNKLYSNHQKSLMKLAVSQCSVNFSQAVVSALVSPSNAAQDLSDHLMDPLLSFEVLQMPALTSDILLELLSPVYRGLRFAISQPHPIDELFAILATALNFGIKLSSTASLYTSAHIDSLNKLSPLISQITQQLSHILMAAIAPSISEDGFEFGDEEAMALIEQQTRLFLQFALAFQIPEQIVQAIVIDTCNSFDILLFNVIIDTAEEFTDDKITSLLQKIRKLQTMFECLPSNFQTAFANLLNFISQTKALWTGVGAEQMRERSPLLRSIIERCNPKITLPKDNTLDDIGEKVATSSLKISAAENKCFTFSFEWLYTQNATSTWDVI